jgi:hypothetical protein
MAYYINEIAKGHNNPENLTNLETVKVYGRYFPTMNDRNFVPGLRVSKGDGSDGYQGSPFTAWDSTYLSDAQRWYLSTTFLGGASSGPVTIRTWRRAVPMTTGMLQMTIICNAQMHIDDIPSTSRHGSGDGTNPSTLRFTDLEVIHEDMLYGEIYVTGGSTSQDNIDTTYQQLTAFATDGLYNGVTVSSTDDDLEIDVAGKYRVFLDLKFSATVATEWTFAIYKNGSITTIVRPVLASAEQLSLSGRLLDLSVGDVLTVYVKSDDGGGTADLTIEEGAFSVQSVSLV